MANEIFVPVDRYGDGPAPAASVLSGTRRSSALRVGLLSMAVTMSMASCAGTNSKETQDIAMRAEATELPTTTGTAKVTVASVAPVALPTAIGLLKDSRGFGVFASGHIREAAMRYPTIQAAAAEAPISLTASDGTGLRLESLDAHAVIEGPLAFTELRMQFRNPESRVLEGRFQVTLPEGASVSRLAMKTKDGWQEAEMVERQAARRAYEDFLHRKQDPMLLEKEAGNQFRARIFPIPANGIKEVILSYSHELTTTQGYRLPLRGLPMIENLRVRALVAEADGQGTRYTPHTMQVSANVPTADFEVAAVSEIAALRHGSHLVARIRPTLSVPASRLDGLTILFDTSASRAPGFARQVQRLGSLVRTLALAQGDRLPLQIAAFDQSVAPIFDGLAGDFGQEQLAQLLARRPLGASNVGDALRWAGEHAALGRVLMITDAVTTSGESALPAIAADMPAAIERIDVLLVGGIHDDEAAAGLVRGTRRFDGVMLRDAMSDSEIVRRMGDATTSLEVEVAGASWTWPRTMHGIQPGDDFIIYSAFPDSQDVPANVEVQVQGGDTVSLQTVRAPGPLLTRSIVQARIRRLQMDLAAAELAEEKNDIKQAIIALSTSHRVLSDHTALLVLETSADYRRFGIDRKALSDIMTIEDSGVTVQKRSSAIATTRPKVEDTVMADSQGRPTAIAQSQGRPTAMAQSQGRPTAMAESEGRATGQFAMRNSQAPPPPARAIEEVRANADSFASLAGDAVGEVVGASGLGISGTGRGGSGTGWGTIGTGSYGTIGRGSGTGSGHGYGIRGRAHRASPPQVRLGNAVVSGSLDRAIIRRFVRRQLPRIRYCYERAQTAQPSLRGTVTARFLIAESGTVQRATATGMDNSSVESCIATALRSIQFPKHPGEGPVTVSYPFSFQPAAPTSTVPEAWSPGEPSQVPSPGQTRRPARIAEQQGPPALTGSMATIHDAIEAGNLDDAIARALVWRNEESGNVMALVALGEALQAAGQTQLAARAYGSIIDLFPSRADLRRFAAARLVALGDEGAPLAVDSLTKAEEQRPDHLSVHRLLAFALVRTGNLEAAFAALETGLARNYPGGRFAGGTRILREDLGIVASAWLAKDGSKREGILNRLANAGSTLATRRSTRFVLNWETDANDVDFHIYDAKGGHAYYSDRRLPSGGELFADVTTGYGPECFAINGKATAYPYDIQIHYYSRGPMGYGMGQVEVLQHDGKGGLKFDTRPFVVMNDSAYVALGRIEKPL